MKNERKQQWYGKAKSGDENEFLIEPNSTMCVFLMTTILLSICVDHI